MPARKKTARPIGKGEFAAALQEIRDDPDREGTFEQSTIDAAMKGDAERIRNWLLTQATGTPATTATVAAPLS